MSPLSNDNDSNGSPPRLDAQGQAALLLVESLIHSLIAQSVITVAKAVEIIDVASSISREMDEAAGGQPTTTPSATTLLEALSRSLSRDLPREVDPSYSPES